MTQTGSRSPPQSEALQSDPTNSCGGQRYRKAERLDKAEPIYVALIDAREKRPPLEAIIGLVEVYRLQKNAARLLDVLGDSVGRAGSLTLLGDAGKALLADKETARAVVDAAGKQLADVPAELDYPQRLATALVALGLDDFDTAEKFFDAALEAEDAKPSEVFLNC